MVLEHLKGLLYGKKILLGITGSIAAYKAAFLTRLLIKSGAEVKILMTPTAAEFITPLTLSTLSKNPVFTEVAGEQGWNNHVELGLWADAMLVAPCTASTLSKMANGLCDNMIVAAYLSARCPVFIAPAMDVDMWHHSATQTNINTLNDYGNHLIPVGVGELASGLEGAGRMAEPEDIIQHLTLFFEHQNTWKGKELLITAGPTFEPIDPVRFIGNRSSGKMGIALAEAAAEKGAKVHLVLGPTALRPQHPGVKVYAIQTANQMYTSAIDLFPKVDIGIMAAAVSDYRPLNAAKQKMKKTGEELQIDLVENPDIAASLGKLKTKEQILIGFALETNDAFANAQKKLQKKNLDLIVLNSLEDKGAGFNYDTNKISILDQDNNLQKFELKTKKAVAIDILNTIQALIDKK